MHLEEMQVPVFDPAVYRSAAALADGGRYLGGDHFDLLATNQALRRDIIVRLGYLVGVHSIHPGIGHQVRLVKQVCLIRSHNFFLLPYKRKPAATPLTIAQKSAFNYLY
jgi:hypothetical protein